MRHHVLESGFQKAVKDAVRKAGILKTDKGPDIEVVTVVRGVHPSAPKSTWTLRGTWPPVQLAAFNRLLLFNPVNAAGAPPGCKPTPPANKSNRTRFFSQRVLTAWFSWKT